MWVMPSSSARCAQLPRAADKVPFYAALKKFRDYLNGAVSEIDDKELVFSYSRLKNFFEPEIKEEKSDSCGVYNYSKVNELTDISNVKRDNETGDVLQVKKKRGRPKKIKIEGQNSLNANNVGQKVEEPKIKLDEKTGIPKKKRGRPKKIKVESEIVQPPPSEHSNPTPSHCFSPPIQSPSMQFPIYPQQHYSQSSQSPLPVSYHQNPYTHSPQPPSFTHSDLSSEISAAISSEHNPDSPTLGPPDFDPPANMNEDVSKSPERKDDDCHFSSPQSKKSYQYDEFSTDSDSGVRYPQKTSINQDVSSKSLSGLESLVDQIPNIGDHEPAQTSNESEHMGSQYSEDSAYLSDYPRSAHFSPQYNTTTSNSYLAQHTNFSVTSLANSSSTTSESNNSTFSVNSITGNYTTPTAYNMMGPPAIVELESSSVPCRLDSPRNGLPYPYQYPTAYAQNTPAFYPTTAHNIHVPSPNFPYAPPYANTYPQASYISNHMFDRIKADRMDIGFGSF